LTCAYDVKISSNEDECRSQVIPKTGEKDLLLDFSCPDEFDIKWRSEAGLSGESKQLACNIDNGPNWEDVEPSLRGLWPLCGKLRTEEISVNLFNFTVRDFVSSPVAFQDGKETSYFDVADSASERSIEFAFEVGVSGDWESVFLFLNDEEVATFNKDGSESGKWVT